MTAAFRSELWMRPPTESWHVHTPACDVGASVMRTKVAQEWLILNHLTTAGTLKLAGLGLGMSSAPVAVWGGRKGSLQLGSAEDRQREAHRSLVARIRQRAGHYSHVHVAMRRKGHLSPAMRGLLEMGRMLDEWQS